MNIPLKRTHDADAPEIPPGLEGFYQKAHKRKIPLSVQIQLTDLCNLRCEYCYNSTEHKTNELSYDEIVGILEQLREAGTLYVCLTGGEPTLHPRFADIARKVRELGFSLEMITNGTLLKEWHYQLFQELSPQYIAVSLHGMRKASHERLTHSAESFNKTRAAIERMKELGLPVQLRISVTQYNFHELEEMIFYAEALGINYRYDCNVTYREDGDPTSAVIRVGSDALENLFERQWRETLLKSDAPVIGFNDKSMRAIDEGNLCAAGHTYCYIDSQGTVHPCPSYQRPAGSLRELTFKEIWYESDFLKKLRATTYGDIAGCSGCGDKPFCTFCPGNARLEGSDKENGFASYGRACKNAAINRKAFEDVSEQQRAAFTTFAN